MAMLCGWFRSSARECLDSPGLSSEMETEVPDAPQVSDGAPAERLIRVRPAINAGRRDRVPRVARQDRKPAKTGAASKPKFPPNPPGPHSRRHHQRSRLGQIRLRLIAETNSRTAKESAFAARTPWPSENRVPKLRKPPSKFGISDTPDPMPELEKPERPKDEFPKSEPPMPETPKREPPKFADGAAGRK